MTAPLTDDRIRSAILTLLRPHLQAAKLDEKQLTDDSSLIDLGLVDSFQLVSLIVGLQDELGIEIDFLDASPNDFASISGLVRIARTGSS
jgi:acyl carrier protein